VLGSLVEELPGVRERTARAGFMVCSMLLGRGGLDGRAGRCYKTAVDLRTRPLVRGEVGDASRLLARAFAADPFIGSPLADASRRRLACPPFFRAVLYELTEFGAVYAVE
jgi:hypothetical protein